MRISNPKSVVAIVDDDQRLLELLEDLLEFAERGTPCGLSRRPRACSTAILCQRSIVDIGMPGMDGFALQRLMRERRPDLPVILITGRHEIAELPQSKHNRFFRKPFDGQALLAAIGDALTGKKNPP